MGEMEVDQDKYLVEMGCDLHYGRDSGLASRIQAESVAGSFQMHSRMAEQVGALRPAKAVDLAFGGGKACGLDHRSIHSRSQEHVQSREKRLHMLAYGGY